MTDGATPRAPAVWAWVADALEAERSRWFNWVPVFLGCGIAIYFALPVEPPLWSGGLAVVAAVVLRRVAGWGTFGDMATAMLALGAAGFALVTLRTGVVTSPVLVSELPAAELRGFVTLVEPRAEGGARVTLRVTNIAGLDTASTPHRVRLSVPGPRTALSPGEAIVVVARLSPPATAAVPGGYDFARYAFFQRLGGVGYALQPPRRDDAAGRAPASMRLAAAIETVRQAINARIAAVLPGETGAIAAALITGERGAISNATNEAYRDSGLFHILSISGLHMAIMGGSVFWVVRFFLALAPGIALRRPTKKWAAVVALLASLGYLAISGGSFATIRSFIMIAVMFLAVLLDRPAIAMRNVAVSALVILVIYPESLLDAGFQMSFAAVVALVAAYEALRDRLADRERRLGLGLWLKGALFFGGIVFSTLVASAAVAPFAAYHFHKSQQYAVIANLIAVPLTNLVVMPAALATLVAVPFGLEAGPLLIMGAGIDAMTDVARRVAALPGAVAHFRAMPDAAFAMMLGGGLWLLLWHARWRLLGLVAIAAGLGLAPLRAAPDLLVGRSGDLVAIRGADGTLAFLTVPGARFEIEQWLEHDGDGRQAADIVDARQSLLAAQELDDPTPSVARAAPALQSGAGTVAAPRGGEARVAPLRCDGIGCATVIGGTRIAIPRHPAAVAADCRRADVVVSFVAAPPGCAPQVAIVDRPAVSAFGTHAVYVEAPRSVRIETVFGRFGRRPWSRPQWNRATAGASTVPLPMPSRLPEFASLGLAELLATRRPDAEDAAATLDAGP
ncbi:MAG: ComEC/Rec2 family competence protein [Hyphomicrobiaceae bacterium]